jgi:hypothetical protein
MMMFVVSCQC